MKQVSSPDGHLGNASGWCLLSCKNLECKCLLCQSHCKAMAFNWFCFRTPIFLTRSSNKPYSCI